MRHARHAARLLLAAALLATTAACRSLPPATLDATLSPGVKVELPAPALPAALHREQLLNVAANGHENAIHVVLDADGAQVALAGLSPLGVRLFKLVYDNAGIHGEQLAIVDELPPPNQVLADIMFAYWPLEAWAARLPAGWKLADENPARRILRNPAGEPILEITYANHDGAREPVALAHRIFGYEIRITNLATQD